MRCNWWIRSLQDAFFGMFVVLDDLADAEFMGFICLFNGSGKGKKRNKILFGLAISVGNWSGFVPS